MGLWCLGFRGVGGLGASLAGVWGLGYGLQCGRDFSGLQGVGGSFGAFAGFGRGAYIPRLDFNRELLG